MDWLVRGLPQSDASLDVALSVPGDKSISHRAVMLASIANGVSQITGFLDGEDTRATLGIMRQLGVSIIEHSPTSIEVHGVGLHGLRASSRDLDCGNAGTGMRLLAGLLSGQSFPSTLVGDESLSKRPMQRIIEPLEKMGASIASHDGGRPPLSIHGHNALQGITYAPSVASAQVKSAVLLAGLYATGTTRVDEVTPTRDYTEQMLREMGWPIELGPGFAQLKGGDQLNAMDIDVPGDFSSAAFPLVAAIVGKNITLRLTNVGLSPTRTGLFKALKQMGADISIENQRNTFAGPVGDIIAKSSHLQAIDLSVDWVPDMIDEIPVFCVAAVHSKGTTRIRGAGELRVKESDRIDAMATNLQRLGIGVTVFDDGMDIEGSGDLALTQSIVRAFDDHRIAMSFAVLAGASNDSVEIQGVDNVATSFPRFAETMAALGCGITVKA